MQKRLNVGDFVRHCQYPGEILKICEVDKDQILLEGAYGWEWCWGNEVEVEPGEGAIRPGWLFATLF